MADDVRVWLLNRGKPMYVSVADVPELLSRGFTKWPHKETPKEKYYPHLDAQLNPQAHEMITNELAVDEALDVVVIE